MSDLEDIVVALNATPFFTLWKRKVEIANQINHMQTENAQIDAQLAANDNVADFNRIALVIAAYRTALGLDVPAPVDPPSEGEENL